MGEKTWVEKGSWHWRAEEAWRWRGDVVVANLLLSLNLCFKDIDTGFRSFKGFCFLLPNCIIIIIWPLPRELAFLGHLLSADIITPTPSLTRWRQCIDSGKDTHEEVYGASRTVLKGSLLTLAQSCPSRENITLTVGLQDWNQPLFRL